MSDFLYPHQKQAIDKMFSGCILNGGVGSGKSRTGIYFYFHTYSGSIENQTYTPMKNPPDLIIITTAKKRNDCEWERELAPYWLVPDPDTKKTDYYGNRVFIDSWNNIKKYADMQNCFFIFDEDKLCGKGAWTKAFLKIVKTNKWIILSATSGDTWMDYETVFVANGFFRTRSEFRQEHLIYSPYNKKFPEVIGYRNETRLIRLRERLLIDMDFTRHTIPHHEDVKVTYDMNMYKDVLKTRTDPYKQGYIPCRHYDPDGLLVGRDIKLQDVTPIIPGWDYEPCDGDYVKLINEPIQQAAGLCYVLRKIVNSDESRQIALLELFEKHPRMIIFYSFDYERDILLNLYYGEDVKVAEYSGHAHNAIPNSDKWVYLVNYSAGAEGFNCIKTNCIVFYSQNYSYKIMTQAAGRIDRLNTPYTDLYYYHFKSNASIDLAIAKALREKKKFNERKFAKFD